MRPMTYPPNLLIFLVYLFALSGCSSNGASERSMGDAGTADLGLDGLVDEVEVECLDDADCDDFSSCSVDTCFDGVCRHVRMEPTATVEELINVPDDVVDLELVGDVLFVARGEAGVQAWNIAEIPARKLLEVEPETGHAPYSGVHQYTGGLIVRSDRWIYIFDGTSGNLQGEYRAGDEVRDLIRFGEQAVVLAIYARGIEVVDIGNGLFPERIGRVDTLGRAARLAMVEDTLLVADGLLGVSTVDLAEPATPVITEQTIRTEGRVEELSASGRHVAFNEMGAGLGLLEVREGAARRLLRYPVQLDVMDVHLIDPSTVAVVTRQSGLVLFDLSIVEETKEWGRIDLGGDVKLVGRKSDGVLVVRADGRAVSVQIGCGVEGDPLASPPDAGAADAGDAGVDGPAE